MHILPTPPKTHTHTTTTPSTQVPSLRQLNLYGCRRASGAQLQVVLDSLTHLNWASFNGCVGLQSLHLTREYSTP
jgi:hypothetical protein